MLFSATCSWCLSFSMQVRLAFLEEISIQRPSSSLIKTYPWKSKLSNRFRNGKKSNTKRKISKIYLIWSQIQLISGFHNRAFIKDNSNPRSIFITDRSYCKKSQAPSPMTSFKRFWILLWSWTRYNRLRLLESSLSIGLFPWLVPLRRSNTNARVSS